MVGDPSENQHRESGLQGVQPMPWGAHACYAYRCKTDLVEALVPYFGAGLRHNEACLWIVSGGLEVREARQALLDAMPQLAPQVSRGQIEIRDAAEWYTPGSRFDAQDVLEAWAERERQAVARGYSGLRISGDTAWLEPSGWKDLMEYERRVDALFSARRVLALCTYCMENRSPEEMAEVVRNHQFSLTPDGQGRNMMPTSQPKEAPPAQPTLGDVLYAKKPQSLILEDEWVALVRSVASGDQIALHGLYERAHRLVFTLCMRITHSRETAEELTVDVFHDVWRRAAGYDAVNGTVLGWIMNQARSRAIDRLRFEQRKKRVEPNGDGAPANDVAEARDAVEIRQESAMLRSALAALTSDERQAVETAFFGGLTYAEAAARLNEPLGTIKTRIRSALHKLRHALAAEGRPS